MYLFYSTRLMAYMAMVRRAVHEGSVRTMYVYAVY